MPFPAWAAMAAGSLLTGAWNAREASKNRAFQERMSSTAHAREVADLRAAGLNPMLSVMRGAGASSPGGDRAQIEDLGRSVGSAMQSKLLGAQLELTRAQTQREVATAQSLTNQTQESFAGRSFRLDQLRDQSQLAALTVQEKQQLLPLAMERARAEIEQTVSSAEASRARARLDQLDQVRAMNEAEFEAALGQASPALRAVLLIVRSIR